MHRESITEIIGEKRSRKDYLSLRIDKTVPGGLRITKRVCNENCIFDYATGAKCHDDIVQNGDGEALSNAAKHAQASRVAMVLHENNETVMLQISDNGKGFSLIEPAARKDTLSGLGLISMRERTELHGGDFAIESEPGRGTTVTVTIPLHLATRNNEENAPSYR